MLCKDIFAEKGKDGVQMFIKDVGLYFHIPFCRTRCPYCDFYSTTTLHAAEEYIQALCRAVKMAPLDGYQANSLYFGGGTPSLLGERLLPVLEVVAGRLPFSSHVEITLEANPGELSFAQLKTLYTGGFNRVSLGLQAGEEEGLHVLGRGHTISQSIQAVDLCRQAGFKNISVDIMLATPGQNIEKATALASWVADLGVEHVSAYLLKIEPGTAFAQKEVGTLCPSDEEGAEIYLAVCQRLEARGFIQYEISNFARPGYESRHNLRYWQLKEYLGIGSSAHSFFKGRRFYFPSNLEGFIMAENPWTLVKDEDTGDGWEELVMLALRLARGLDLAQARRLNLTRTEILEARLPSLVAAGLVIDQKDRVALTPKGFLLSNQIINRLIQ